MPRTELHTYVIVCDGQVSDGTACTSQVVLSCAAADLDARLAKRYDWKVVAAEAGTAYFCPGHHTPFEPKPVEPQQNSS